MFQISNNNTNNSNNNTNNNNDDGNNNSTSKSPIDTYLNGEWQASEPTRDRARSCQCLNSG